MVSTIASNTTPAWYQMSRYFPPYHYTPSIKLQMFWWIPYQSDIKFFYTKLIFDIRHSSSFFPWYESLILLLVYILKYVNTEWKSWLVMIMSKAHYQWGHYWCHSYYIYLLMVWKSIRHMLIISLCWHPLHIFQSYIPYHNDLSGEAQCTKLFEIAHPLNSYFTFLVQEVMRSVSKNPTSTET
jgi:hypothetical protein